MTDYKLVPVLGDGLLPCPFCGGDDIGNRYIETYSCDSSYDIFGCKACGAGFNNDDQSGPSLWNRRAAAPAVQGEPLITLLIDDPEQTANGWELGEWDVEPNAAAVEAFAKQAGPGTYGLYAAPPPAEQPEPISRNLRAVHVMILNALDRDAADGKAVRGEMAEELRSALSEQQPAPDVAGLVQQHHRDSAELRRLCQARDEQRDGRIAALERAAKALELAVKAEADVAGLVEALEWSVAGFDALSGMESLDSGARNYARLKAIELNASLAAHRKGGDHV